MTGTADHWDEVYRTRRVDEVSWHRSSAATSLRVLGDVPTSCVDVGAGASVLVDDLLAGGCTDVTLLDVSEQALDVTRRRIGSDARVRYVVGDVLSWRPDRTFAAWHDRAVLHFLTSRSEQAAYVESAAATVEPGGVLAIGTFAEDGPSTCSGLPTTRFSADGLSALFGDRFEVEHTERETHRTPSGADQPFTWVRLRRRSRDGTS